MNGDMAYRHNEIREQGLFRKLCRWSAEEEFSESVDDRKSLLESIHQARQEWLNAIENFNQAENEELVEYYIYRMKACQVRYNYLLKMAKETGLRQNIYEAQ